MEKWLEYASNLRKVGIGDWIEEWDIRNIYTEVAKLEAGQTYLEIGVAHGASLAIANLAAKEGVKLFGIDVLDWFDREDKIQAFLDIYGKQKQHEFIEGESQLWARFWNRNLVDVLFIDGDHTYEGVIKDIASWIPNVKPNGLIMFDDYNDKERVKEAINEIIKNHGAFYDHKVDGEMFLCRKK